MGRRQKRRTTCGGSRLAAGALFLLFLGPLHAQSGLTAEVLGAFNRIEAEGATALLELYALSSELESYVLGNPEAEGEERQAYLASCVLLADLTDSLPEPRPDPLALLKRGRSVADGSVDDAYRAWADFSYAARLVGVGRFHEAEAVLNESLAGPAPGTQNEMAILNLLADVLRSEGRLMQALDVLQVMDDRLTEIEEATQGSGSAANAAQAAVWRARTHGSRGLLEQRLGRFDLAVREHELEGEYARLSGDAWTRAAYLTNRCDLGLRTEDYAFVADLLEGLEEKPFYASMVPERQALFHLYRGIAQSELERDFPDRDSLATATLEDALVQGQLPFHERVVACRVLADLALRRGDWDKAGAHIEAMRGLLHEDEGGSEHVSERVFLETLQARLALDGEGSAADLRARLDEVAARWGDLLEEWSRTPVSPGGIGFLHHSERREILGTLLRLHLAVDGSEKGPENGLARVLEAERQGTLARRLELPEVGLDDLRAELLGEEHGVLLYLPSRERSHVLGFDRETVWHVELASWSRIKSDLFELLAKLRRHPARLADPEDRSEHAAELDRLTRRISERLFPNALQERIAAWKCVTVLGTEHLGNLPPEALRFTDGRFLGVELAVDVAPSLTVAMELKRRSERMPAHGVVDLALFATVDPGSKALAIYANLEARSISERDVRGLIEPFGERHTSILGEAVTQGSLFDAELGAVPVVHILAHGLRLDDRERQAALVLSGNDEKVELLTCEDVEASLRLSGLVILSACATARGPSRPGDDSLAHLGGAFLVAGARTVILAQTHVVFEETLRLMKVVHERLAQGASPAEAMRAAREAVASSDDPLAPYFAVQFGVLGLGHEPALK